MSELAVGSLAGLAANSYVIDVASGSQLTQPGMVLQVVSTTKTDTFTTTSTSFTDITGLTASITPSSTSSKVLVMVSVIGMSDVDDATSRNIIRLERGGTAVAVGDAAGSRTRASTALSTRNIGSAGAVLQTGTVNYLDSPASATSITYAVQAVSPDGGTLFINRVDNDSDADDVARTVSSITLMEIAG